MSTNPVQAASDIVGGQAALARILDVKPPTVNQWVTGERRVPAEHCPAIEMATHAVVTVEQLRSDRRWERVADEAWPHPKGRPLLDFATAVKEAA